MELKTTILHKPVTRRDFLSAGLIPFGAAALVSPLGRLTEALASELGVDAAPILPFITIDCAGGAALTGNFVVGGPKGAKDLLPSYDRLGWNPSEGIDEQFGLPLPLKSSQILQGILATTTPEARANFRMGSICHFAQSDTSSNLLSSVGLLQKWGYRGTNVSFATGVVNSLSAGNSSSYLANSAFQPLVVKSVSDLNNAVTFDSKSSIGKAKTEQKSALLKWAKNLNREQAIKLGASVSAKNLLNALDFSFSENEKNVLSGGLLDARKDPQFSQIYQINANSLESDKAVIFASLVMGAVKGITGPAVLTIGGCDYHDNTQTTGDTKDLEIGQAIGRIVQSAHVLKKPVFFQLITDGGCSNEVGTRKWRSDDNDKCMTVLGYYRPEGPKSMIRQQVGYFNAGQSANLTTIGGIGASPAKVAAATFANYLSLLVPQTQFPAAFGQVVPGDILSGKEIDEVLLFG